MAKVSAHNGHQLATVVASRPGKSADATFRWTLTSDGRVLRRLQSIRGRTHTTGYRLCFRVNLQVMAAVTDAALTFDERRERATQLLSRALHKDGMVQVTEPPPS